MGLCIEDLPVIRGEANKKKGDSPMKAFLEEYGVIIVAAIVICLIIVAATPIGTAIKTGIMNSVTTLTTRLNSETANYTK